MAKSYNLSGALFKNERQREGHQDPEYNGSCLINGEEYWISGWVKRPEGKKPFFSLKFNPKKKQQQQPREERPRSQAPPPP